MSYVVFVLLLSLVLGFIGVASNPSPYFAALSLVYVAASGCGVLAYFGGPFLSLVLFLIYLGGMLVVFAYSAALAAEQYPEGWGSWPVLVYAGLYLVGVLLVFVLFFEGGWFEFSVVPKGEADGFVLFRADTSGVALMYSFGCWVLIIGAWGLLLTLFVVLELTRGLERGALRVV
uniref:NADH-ubiquinone oxidoreductase chain 6 n=2 Tax=Syngnathinae TaxID=129914 RepID=A0A7D5FJM7_MICDA|nr:NADH dehydrogenase subunit 6 [Oostethus manadensis]YP_009914980.1 NADH dehydrogenase subunit 6 [Microphis deocata]AKG95381.1 NADH dehydrogenase subunit 6 [Oostethus manadensis]QLF67691.1 NADH dehydrogenase subunit 6 [Microphis deocata]